MELVAERFKDFWRDEELHLRAAERCACLSKNIEAHLIKWYNHLTCEMSRTIGYYYGPTVYDWSISARSGCADHDAALLRTRGTGAPHDAGGESVSALCRADTPGHSLHPCGASRRVYARRC